MKLPLALLCSLLALTTGAFAAAPNTNAPPAAPAPAPAPAPVPGAPTITLDAYLNDLKGQLNLSDSEKQQIQSAYVDDGAALKSILNDDTLSPLQKAQKVSDIRDARNAKIESLLFDFDRKQQFLQVEAKYRVALTLLAADGGQVASAPAAK